MATAAFPSARATAMSETSPEASKASTFAQEPKVSRRALPFVPQGKGSAGPEYFATPATGSARVCSLQLSLLAMPQGRGSMLCLASQMASIFRVERCLAEIA